MPKGKVRRKIRNRNPKAQRRKRKELKFMYK